MGRDEWKAMISRDVGSGFTESWVVAAQAR